MTLVPFPAEMGLHFHPYVASYVYLSVGVAIREKKRLVRMFRLMVQWLLSAVALMITTRVVPGFYITTMTSALIAAIVIGFLSATLGYFLKLITFPLVVLTFGIFTIFINAAMIVVASRLVDGFYVYGYQPAVWAAAVLAILGIVIRFVMQPE